jgi:hypothetical protein
MSALRTAALAATLAAGLTASFEAQAYDRWTHGPSYGYGHAQPHWRGHAPVYVHPRIARKQAQLRERFVEKYGYVRPWSHGYHQPRHHWGHPHPRPHVRSWHYGW